MYDVINFDVTSCCDYCIWRGKALAVIKMAASIEEITLIDAETNEAFVFRLNLEDAERVRNGTKIFI